MEIKVTSCCGLKEAYGLQERPEDNVFSILNQKFCVGGFISPLVLFTDKTSSGRGEAVRDFILNNKFGELVETSPTFNPNSGNEIKCYIWTINYDAQKWHEDIMVKFNNTKDEPLKVGDAIALNKKSGNEGWLGYVVELDENSKYVRVSSVRNNGYHAKILRSHIDKRPSA